MTTIYEDTFRQWFDETIKEADKSVFFNAVISGDADTFAVEVNKWLTKSISYHDGYENFYHGFLVGLLQFTDDYTVISNRETGTGRNDIVVKNAISHTDAVVIEIKSAKDDEKLESLCDEALGQLDEKKYISDLVNEGYKKIIKYGIAFKGKYCEVKTG